MDLTAAASIFLSGCFFYGLYLLIISSSTPRRLPPGPFPLPIIGNMHQLGQNPHISLTNLSQKYGPIMHIKLGSTPTIVVSSPEIAKEILLKHDQAFPARTSLAATKALHHHKMSVACLPVGPKWRFLRKICNDHMFSNQRLDASRSLRRQNLNKLRDFVNGCSSQGRVVDIGEAAFVTSLNLISNTLFSIDFADYYNSDSSPKVVRDMVHGLMTVLGAFNLADYVSILGPFDPQGIKPKSEFYFGKFLEIFDGIIDQRLEDLQTKQHKDYFPRKNDMLEALLEMIKDDDDDQPQVSRHDINHLLLDLFVAGTDTTSGSVEWVMTELLRNPNVMQKAKNEIKSVIGEKKEVEEEDISKLPYLQAVIKETLRYHPPGSFIVRRKGENNEVEIKGYSIPKNSVVLINLWAMGRDPSIWQNPHSFEPERFIVDGEIDFKLGRGHNNNFELIPFGGGRRICPGLPLAYRMLHLMVASLIHSFDWVLEGMDPHHLDTRDKFGLSLQKLVSLKALPLPLPIHH